jgi:tetratricopeptide (TPR) repeat protein/DNA-binding XRE family transcriptional regulator
MKVVHGWWETKAASSSGKAKKRLRPIRALLVHLVRELRGLGQEELGAEVGYKKSTISYFERGKEFLGPENTERLMNALGVSPATFDNLLAIAQEIRGEAGEDRWIGPVLISGQQYRRAREYGRTAGNLEARSFEDFILRTHVEEKAVRDREVANQIGIYLRQRENLVQVVREDVGCHLWSVAEWLCEESLKFVAKNRDRAAECAQAAKVIADLVPGDERFRSRLSGYSSGHIGNIERVKNEFEEAEATFGDCSRLWRAGEGGDPYGLLDAGRLMGMEASLRREQGRFPEGVRLLKDALPIAARNEQPYLCLNYGIILEQMGDFEGAIRVLEEAAQEAPRHLLLAARYSVGVNLVHLGRHDEAEALLPEVSRLCIEAGSKDYQTRVRWLAGRLALGRGRSEEALGAFKSVQQEFLEQGSSYDAAVVSLDLAKFYLQRRETAVVKRLAEEMAPTFVNKGVHHHAQEALKLFAAAAVREAASVELVARILKYLERARRSHCLRFEGIAA